MFRFIVLIIITLLLFSCSPKAVKKESGSLEKPDYSSLYKAYVLKEQVNVRASHSTRAGIVKRLNDGEEVQIIRNVNGWYEIKLDQKSNGWVRSDLVGPRLLSRTCLAAAFVDSVLPAFDTQIYFDKKGLYRIVYMVLAESFYKSKNAAERQAKKIGKVYQEKVYAGNVEIRVIFPESKSLFTKVELKGIGNPDVPVPILESGRLVLLKTGKRNEVALNIAVPQSVNNQQLLKMARNISSAYDYTFTKIEIYIAADTAEGLAYLKDTNQKPLNTRVCRLYYLEDKHGEDYRFNYCDR